MYPRRPFFRFLNTSLRLKPVYDNKYKRLVEQKTYNILYFLKISGNLRLLDYYTIPAEPLCLGRLRMKIDLWLKHIPATEWIIRLSAARKLSANCKIYILFMPIYSLYIAYKTSDGQLTKEEQQRVVLGPGNAHVSSVCSAARAARRCCCRRYCSATAVAAADAAIRQYTG